MKINFYSILSFYNTTSKDFIAFRNLTIRLVIISNYKKNLLTLDSYKYVNKNILKEEYLRKVNSINILGITPPYTSLKPAINLSLIISLTGLIVVLILHYIRREKSFEPKSYLKKYKDLIVEVTRVNVNDELIVLAFLHLMNSLKFLI